MFYIKEYETGYLHTCEDCKLREYLYSCFVCADYSVRKAIDAICDNPLSPETYWAEAYLNLAIYHRD